MSIFLLGLAIFAVDVYFRVATILGE